MNEGQDFYQRLGRDTFQKMAGVLYSIAPDGAKKIHMRAELAPEGDACDFRYDYENANNERGWFTAGGRANTDLLKLLIDLREQHVRENLTHGHPAWNGLEFTVDVEAKKFKAEFKYD